jgi:hypothetical protein
MEIGSILLVLAVTILASLFVARPFIENRKNLGAVNSEHELSTLLANRDKLIEAIQELDFDNSLGKIPAEDYPSMRAVLLKRAAAILKQLDEMGSVTQTESDIELKLESEIASKRTDAALSKAASAKKISDDDLEEILAARRSARKEKATGFCPNCGKPILKSDKFCPTCGKTQN